MDQRERTIGEVIADQTLIEGLRTEYPEEADTLPDADGLGELTELTTRLAGAFAICKQQLEEREVPSDLEVSNNTDRITNTSDVDLDVEYLLAQISNESAQRFKARQALVEKAQKSLVDYTLALTQTTRMGPSKKNTRLSRERRKIEKAWDIKTIIKDPEQLLTLFGVYKNTIEYSQAGEDLHDYLRKALVKYVVEIGEDIKPEQLTGLYKLLETAPSDELTKIALDTIIASFDAVSAKSPEDVIKHHGTAILATVSMGHNPDLQKELAKGINGGALVASRGKYHKRLTLPLVGYKCPEAYVTHLASRELCTHFGIESIFVIDSGAMDVGNQIISGETYDDDMQDTANTLLGYLRRNGIDSEKLEEFGKARAEFQKMFGALADGMSTALNDIISESDDITPQQFRDIHKRKRTIQKAELNGYEELENEIREKFESIDPEFVEYFLAILEAESHPYMQQFRQLFPGRTEVNTLLEMMRASDFRVKGSDILDDQEFPQYTAVRDGLSVLVAPISSIASEQNPYDIPEDVIQEANDSIKSLPSWHSPHIEIVHGDYLYLFRPTTVYDRQRIKPVEGMAPFQGMFVPGVKDTFTDMASLANYIDTRRQRILDNTHLFINERGIHVDVNLSDKLKANVTIKKSTSTTGVIEGTLEVNTNTVPFIVDANGRIFFSPKSPSYIEQEMTIFVQNIIEAYSCGDLLDGKVGSESGLELYLRKRAGHLRLLEEGKNFSKDQQRLFLEHHGLDLSTISESRKKILDTTRNTTYVRPVEKVVAGHGPLRLHFDDSVLKGLKEA